MSPGAEKNMNQPHESKQNILLIAHSAIMTKAWAWQEHHPVLCPSFHYCQDVHTQQGHDKHEQLDVMENAETSMSFNVVTWLVFASTYSPVRSSLSLLEMDNCWCYQLELIKKKLHTHPHPHTDILYIILAPGNQFSTENIPLLWKLSASSNTHDLSVPVVSPQLEASGKSIIISVSGQWDLQCRSVSFTH